MSKGYEVLEMLLPNGGWTISGDDFENIQFIEATPITKEEFEAGFDLVDAWKAQAEAIKATEKQQILAQLGITEEQAKLLLS